jgi:hypothetical protein
MGNRGIASPFLTLALVGVEWSALGSDPFTFGERVAGTHWIGGWVGPSSSLDAVK